MAYICIGVPYWIGVRQRKAAADAVKASGLAAELGADWIDVRADYGACADPVAAVNRALAETLRQFPGYIPLVFAGDCVSALGALKGLENRRPAALWYDAHGDFNTPETTLSGFLGGMPLAALVGRGNEPLMQALELAPIPETDVIITDARDLDPEEGVNLRASRITHLPEVRHLLDIALPDRPLYVHFDVDVIDCDEMPALSYPAAGGPSLAETEATLRRVARDAQVAAVLFSLWNDEETGSERALANTLRLARSFAAERR